MMSNIKTAKNSEVPLRAEGESLRKDKLGSFPEAWFQTSLEKMQLHPNGWQRNFLGCQMLRELEQDYNLTAKMHGIHIRKAAGDTPLWQIQANTSRHTEKAGMPLCTCDLEHTVCHQYGLSKMVTGSRSGL